MQITVFAAEGAKDSYKSAHLNVAAKLLSNRYYILGNGHGVILNVSPLKKAVIFS